MAETCRVSILGKNFKGKVSKSQKKTKLTTVS